jgi:hypothetical protein
MKIIAFILILGFYSLQTLAQTTQKFTFKQIGLSLELPADFKLESVHESNQNARAGIDILTEENKIPVDFSQLTTLFSAKKDEYSYIGATIVKLDTIEDDSYDEAHQQLRELLFLTFKRKIEHNKIDSSTTEIIIDGVKFEKFNVNIELKPNTFLYTTLISGLYKGFELGISFVYVDEKTKEQFDELIKSIRFQ